MNDEYIVDNPQVRQFIGEVQQCIATSLSPAQALQLMRPAFAALLADAAWLPSEFRQPTPQSGMGGGIASWLLYRAGDGSLSLFSLVVPPDASTPVHDHLAWGLVGLYVGKQEEEVYQRMDDGSQPGVARLLLTTRHRLEPGDFYELLPPAGDIHRVKTTSTNASVSIHLLGCDAGCILRHTFDPAASTMQEFRSGYTNAPCDEG